VSLADINVELIERCSRIKALFCDVDGILTDGTVWSGSPGEYKRFSVLDGMGIRLLREQGIKVGWVSGRFSEATQVRAGELNIDLLHQSGGLKAEIVAQAITKWQLAWEDIAFMGDDVIDLGVMQKAGLAVTVPNGVDEVRAVAHYITQREGGRGAVREVIEIILKSQHKWVKAVQQFSSEGKL
jgi:3-deoxy-D-manno-octulosonate 8-phosphate phosphatase (KDO 8-P phosphatase)